MNYDLFTNHIPEDRWYCTQYNMWVKTIGKNEVLIGASSFGIFLAGKIIAFTSKPCGAKISLGRGMGTVECRKTVLAVHAPVSFILLEGNERLEMQPKILNQDPYHEGWMARAQITPPLWEIERKRLIDATAYRQHISSIESGASFD